MRQVAQTKNEIMTIENVATLLRCHQTTVYRLIKERGFPAFKLGSDWRFKRSEIDRWVREKGRIR
jgi:excisionase family DNA binding protein